MCRIPGMYIIYENTWHSVWHVLSLIIFSYYYFFNPRGMGGYVALYEIA